MKNSVLFLLFILSINIHQAIGQNRNSALQFKLRNNKLLTVVIDGRHYKRYGRSIAFGDVPNGTHDIKVYRFYPNDDPRYNGYNSRPKAILVYRGKIHILPATMYYCTIDPEFKTMSIKESRNIPLYDDEESYRIDQSLNFSEEQVEDESTVNINNHSNRIDQNNQLTEQQLTELCQNVRKQLSHGDKINAITTYLGTKTLSTNQVATILSNLTFESSKLEIAQYCYPNVIDKENYQQIVPLLTFQSSKNTLSKYIANSENDIKNNNQAEVNNSAKKQILPSNVLAELAKNIQSKKTDTEKQKELYEQVKNYQFNTTQLMQMLDWLTFEGSKLELCQWAYPRITNKQEFGKVKTKFIFASSKKTIDEMLSKL